MIDDPAVNLADPVALRGSAGTDRESAFRNPAASGVRVGSAVLLLTLLPFSAAAATATGLSSFEGIEEPLVRYAPATDSFKRDDLANITDLGDGTVRMRLRYRPDEWDADRDTPNKDRQRAEVKGLGVHQKTGETFDYTTTWRTSPGFQGADRFCHIFQLKSTNGDSGAPLVTVSISEGRERATIQYWSGTARNSSVAREFAWKPGTWQTVRVRIKTSPSNDGEVLASIDGDELQGVRGIAVFRPDATDYRPKWGLYRGVKAGMLFGDDYVEHKNVSAEKVGAPAEPRKIEMETTARKLMHESPAKALAWLESQPPSPARAETFRAITTEWAQSDPAAAMAAVVKLAPTDGRDEAMQRVFNRWSDQDADAVLRWAAGRAPAAELDQMLWYFATDTTLRYVAREKALTGAGLIADPELRAEAIEHVVLIWARREPKAAAQCIEESKVLTTSQKAAIRQKIGVGQE
jgi:hypothetical protein